MDLVKSLRTTLLYLWWLLLAVLPHYSKVRWGACFLILSLHVLSILIKNLKKKQCTNNYLLSRDKTTPSLLELIDHVLSISEYVLNKHLLLMILMENLLKALRKYLCNIMYQKTFFACTLHLIKCFQFQEMIWKTKVCHVSKNIELKIWR